MTALDIGLDARAAAGIRPGDDQHPPGHAASATDWIVSHRPLTICTTAASSSPSAMTRTSGSVPDGRSKHAARAAEPRVRVRHGGHHPRMLERRAASEADVAQQLRQRLEQLADLARRLSGADQHCQHLQRGDQPVAGRGVVGEDHVAGLLAAEVHAARAHLLDDVAVTHPGPVQGQPLRLQEALETEIGHHGRHHAAPVESAGAMPGAGDQRQDLVTVDRLAVLVRPAAAGRRRHRERCRDRRRVR